MKIKTKLIIECCKDNRDTQVLEELITHIQNWNELISLSFSHGVFPIVYKVLKEYETLIPPEIFSKMKIQNLNLAKQNMLMTSELIKLIKLLEENNIQAISFKGPVLSQMAYGDVISRQYVDLDILVHEKDLEKAFLLFESLNYETNKNLKNKILENQSIFHDITFYKNNISFEIHWKLFSNEYKTKFDDKYIWKDFNNTIIQNHKLNSFKNELLILYLSIHGAKHNWERIEWLLDIKKYCSNHNIDWKYLLKLSKETKSEKILFSTLYLCHLFLQMQLPKNVFEKIQEPKYLSLSQEFEKLFLNRFENSLSKKIDTKQISRVQYKLLEGFKPKALFILSLLNPTEQEFKTISLPKSLGFLYYIIRPFNIIARWQKKL